ncbi:uncharacterized protein LOC118164830 [Oxyura jamaicensis]|uniref:uncharacterized protein LOC118164830 n=1 Tax=Oxyura jamaicensis TaxID=8884 RepID=UPI0015A6E1ED|nr:uncharacterized protein LOC118164830 [Oxyura jamaicensis]
MCVEQFTAAPKLSAEQWGFSIQTAQENRPPESQSIHLLPQLKSLSMFQRFCTPGTQNHLQQPQSETGSHRLALEQEVSRSTTSRPSSKSQVFSTWREQAFCWEQGVCRLKSTEEEPRPWLIQEGAQSSSASELHFLQLMSQSGPAEVTGHIRITLDRRLVQHQRSSALGGHAQASAVQESSISPAPDEHVFTAWMETGPTPDMWKRSSPEVCS